MKLDKIKEYRQFAYSERCDGCGKRQTILTKDDDYPEYYATVYLKCPHCSEDNYIQFNLPVN